MNFLHIDSLFWTLFIFVCQPMARSFTMFKSPRSTFTLHKVERMLQEAPMEWKVTNPKINPCGVLNPYKENHYLRIKHEIFYDMGITIKRRQLPTDHLHEVEFQTIPGQRPVKMFRCLCIRGVIPEQPKVLGILKKPGVYFAETLETNQLYNIAKNFCINRMEDTLHKELKSQSPITNAYYDPHANAPSTSRSSVDEGSMSLVWADEKPMLTLNPATHTDLNEDSGHYFPEAEILQTDGSSLDNRTMSSVWANIHGINERNSLDRTIDTDANKGNEYHHSAATIPGANMSSIEDRSLSFVWEDILRKNQRNSSDSAIDKDLNEDYEHYHPTTEVLTANRDNIDDMTMSRVWANIHEINERNSIDPTIDTNVNNGSYQSTDEVQSSNGSNLKHETTNRGRARIHGTDESDLLDSTTDTDVNNDIGHRHHSNTYNSLYEDESISFIHLSPGLVGENSFFLYAQNPDPTKNTYHVVAHLVYDVLPN